VNETLTEQIIKQVDTFPSMPTAASQLLSMMDDPETDMDAVESVLRNDPGLTANVLRLTNSAYFGLPSRVGSIKKALTFLGLKQLRQLVMASCVTAVMACDVEGYGLPEGDLWRHSVAVSVAAEDLVAELKLQDAGDIFTAALLHDMGKVIMGEFVQEQLPDVYRRAAEGIPFEEAEQQALGTDHAEIGALILEKWLLPEDVVEAVRWHHQPDEADRVSVVTDVVHVANVLCIMMGIGVDVSGLQHRPSSAVVKRLGLKQGQLERVASRTLQWAEELAESLNND